MECKTNVLDPCISLLNFEVTKMGIRLLRGRVFPYARNEMYLHMTFTLCDCTGQLLKMC